MKNKFAFEGGKRLEKLSTDEQEDVVFDLVQAIVQAQSMQEVALFLQDLLTKKEIKTLAKRLRIAKLLLAGMTYETIQENIHVSHGTIAKVAAWLAERGDGFRGIIKKLPQKTESKSWQEYSDWDRFKRKYSLYFWPELLLEEIMKSANKKHKERMKDLLTQMEEKSELHRKIEKLLKV